MKRTEEKNFELSIDPDTVRLFAAKARVLGAGLSDEYEGGHEHEIEFDGDSLTDRHKHDGLVEEEVDDLTAEELRELIEDLNIDEASELVAIVWIGRGDYDAREWKQAVTAATQRTNGNTADYLLRMPMLSNFLEEGLEAIGA